MSWEKEYRTELLRTTGLVIEPDERAVQVSELQRTRRQLEDTLRAGSPERADVEELTESLLGAMGIAPEYLEDIMPDGDWTLLQRRWIRSSGLGAHDYTDGLLGAAKWLEKSYRPNASERVPERRSYPATVARGYGGARSGGDLPNASAYAGNHTARRR